MADFVFTRGIAELFKADTDLDTADMRTLLLTSTYTQDKDDNVVQDLGNELTVGGYARQTLSGEAVTEDDTNDQVYLDATDPTYTAVLTGETVGWQVLFRHTGSDATAPVMCAYDVTNTPTNGSNITVAFAAPASGAALRGV